MLVLHALLFNIKTLMKLKKQLNKNFENICDWFEKICDNKLSIHFGNEKTKSMLFAAKLKVKKVRKVNIRYRGIQIIDLLKLLI